MILRRRNGSGEVLVVRLNFPILDPATVESFRHDLSALAERHSACELLLNFRDVEYVSSAALGAFVSLHRSMLAGGGRLVLCFLRPEVREVLALTKLDGLFVLEDDPAADGPGVVLGEAHGDACGQ
jgi:anti-sigma B factor antagonist